MRDRAILDAKLSSTQKSIEQYEEAKRREEEAALLRDKKAADSQITCLRCGLVKPSDSLVSFAAGPVCKACFMVSTAKDTKEWSKKPGGVRD